MKGTACLETIQLRTFRIAMNFSIAASGRKEGMFPGYIEIQK